MSGDTDDVQFNELLCDLVKRFPALYAPNRSFHRNRKVKNRIWEAIANRLSGTATDCKQRWKAIKSRYSKHFKMKHSRNPRPKGYFLTYYLAPHLKFLDKVIPLQKTKTKATKKATNTGTNQNPRYKLRQIQSSEPLSNLTMVKSPKEVNSIKLDDSFLDSVPDMKGMTPGQNRRFKVGVRNLIARIVEERYAKNEASLAGTSLTKSKT